MQFKPTSNYGFHVTLANGVVVSVQYGWGNYCENRHDRSKKPQMNATETAYDTSRFKGEYVNAEVAAWDDLGNWFTLGDYEAVIGWQTPAEVQKIITDHAAKDLDSAHYWGFWSAEMHQVKLCHYFRRKAVEEVEEFASNIEKLATDLLSMVDDMRSGLEYEESDRLLPDFQAAVGGLQESVEKMDWQSPLERALWSARAIRSQERSIKKHSERAAANSKRAREVAK